MKIKEMVILEGKNKITKQHFLVTILFVTWLTACNILFMQLKIHDTWPAFFICIFFFAYGLSPNRVKEIYAGAISGLVFGYFLPIFLGAMAPILGVKIALNIYIALVLFIILILGPVAHTLVNPVSFTYALMCLINIEEIHETIAEWGLMTILGGTLIIGGIYGIVKMLEMITSKHTMSQTGQ